MKIIFCLKRRDLSCLIMCLLLLLLARPVEAKTIQSDKFILEAGVTPTPTPFQSKVELGFLDNQDVASFRISVSSDLISYGPLSPTNPIKRKLTVSVDSDTSLGFTLFVSEDHPLKDGEHEIADTTCDQGSCTEKVASEWLNPFTFGLGFSFSAPKGRDLARLASKRASGGDDNLYRQFPDSSKQESMIEIPQGTLFVKLNVNQNQALASKKYRNTITFLAIPKL